MGEKIWKKRIFDYIGILSICRIKLIDEVSFPFYRVLTISNALAFLIQHGRITEEIARTVKDFINQNQTQLPAMKVEIENKNTHVPIRQRFQTIIKEKRSNLCLSADLTSLDQIIEVNLF